MHRLSVRAALAAMPTIAMRPARIARRSLALALVVFVLAFCFGWGESHAAGPRIGFLSPGTKESSKPVLDGLRQGLREQGYVEGNNITIEYRYANFQFDRLPELARELIALPVDVLVANVTQASVAARDNTTTIPIVMVGTSDPVASGLVTSLSSPGGNVTGTSGMFSEAAGKRLQLLKEAAPGVRRVAVLWNPSNRLFQSQLLRETDIAAKALGIELRLFEASDVASIERAFTAIATERASGLNVLPDPTLGSYAPRIAAFAQRMRLPSVGGGEGYAHAGFLIGYGPSLYDLARESASYVVKILKGAKPAELPVQQPTRFELVVNLKTARQIGVSVPQSLRARADRLIE